MKVSQMSGWIDVKGSREHGHVIQSESSRLSSRNQTIGCSHRHVISECQSIDVAKL
jgi:hypothetical protein